MPKPIIHLLSVASPCRALLDRLELRAYRQIIALAQDAVGDAYEVTGRPDLMNPRFDEDRGGRRDDPKRCQDIQQALGDPRTRAIVALRGGAWVMRLLPHISFDVLQTRRSDLHLFGFSEFTPLMNIAGSFRRVRAHYHHDAGHLLPGEGDYRAAFATYLRDIVNIVEGRGALGTVTGRLVRGDLKAQQRIRIVGGCLSVLISMYGTPFQKCVDPAGRWVALEDVHDEPPGIDRHLAQLKMAGVFQKCRGLLLGDFHVEYPHEERHDQTPAVLELLKYHLPPRRKIPIIAYGNFGHCHPAAPLLLHRPVTLVREGRGRRTVRITSR